MNLWKRLEAWQQAAIIVIALLGAGWSAYATVNPVLEQIAANTSRLDLITYDRLLRKMQAQGRLSPRDLRAFCGAAWRLRIKHRACR